MLNQTTKPKNKRYGYSPILIGKIRNGCSLLWYDFEIGKYRDDKTSTPPVTIASERQYVGEWFGTKGDFPTYIPIPWNWTIEKNSR